MDYFVCSLDVNIALKELFEPGIAVNFCGEVKVRIYGLSFFGLLLPSSKEPVCLLLILALGYLLLEGPVLLFHLLDALELFNGHTAFKGFIFPETIVTIKSSTQGIIIAALYAVLGEYAVKSLRSLIELRGLCLGVLEAVLDDVLNFGPFYRSGEFKEISRRISTFEYNFVADRAVEMGFDGFMQERSSAKEEYTPAFDLEGI